MEQTRNWVSTNTQLKDTKQCVVIILPAIFSMLATCVIILAPGPQPIRILPAIFSMLATCVIILAPGPQPIRMIGRSA